AVTRLCLLWCPAIACFCVTSCATTSHHKFSEPTANWQTKNGQMMYRRDKTTLIGDVLVRFSKGGDFELSLSKGPVTLLTLRQDASFAEVNGPFAKGGWSGPVEQTKTKSRCALGSACATSSLIRKIDRFDIPPERKRSFSAFETMCPSQTAVVCAVLSAQIHTCCREQARPLRTGGHHSIALEA